MRTPSKINLFLRVAGCRSDGYHELETLFYPLETPSDEIEIRKTGRAGIEFVSDDPALPGGDGNLCVKALKKYCAAAGLEPDGYRIELKKHIPVAAGMGGGSSDAAAVLRLMQRGSGNALSPECLADTALSIGADVPFFLEPRPCTAGGIGEKIAFLDGIPDRLPILIAAPRFPVSAKWAYRNWHPEEHGASCKLDSLIAALRVRDFAAAAAFLRNDLEAAVLRKFPYLNMIHDEFLKLGACRVLMTGSGPTLFAMFRDFESRDAAERAFPRADLPSELICPR